MSMNHVKKKLKVGLRHLVSTNKPKLTIMINIFLGPKIGKSQSYVNQSKVFVMIRILIVFSNKKT